MASKLVDGVEAERIGLANRVAAADALDAATEQLAGELLACAPFAVGLAKEVLDGAARQPLARSLERELAAQVRCADSPQFAEALRALAAHREPDAPDAHSRHDAR